MRTIMAFLLGLAALLAGMATLPAAWVAHNVASEDGYVSFTEPLARDQAFHKTIADAVGATLVEKAGLPAVLRPTTSAAITAGTLRIADAPGFVNAWDQTQRQSHRIMFDDQRTLPADLDATNRLAVDLGPMSAYVVDQVNKDLPVALTAPKQIIVSVGGNSSNNALDQIKKTPSWTRDGLIAAVVLGALSLLIARRRAIAVGLLGIGAIAVAAALHGVSAVVIPRLQDDNTSPSALAKPMIDLLGARAGDSFDRWLITLAVGGAIAAVVGFAATLGLSARGKA